MDTKKIKASIRKLSELSTEILRAGESELVLEVQQMIVRLMEIQDKLVQKEEK